MQQPITLPFLANQFSQMKQHVDRLEVKLLKAEKRIEDLQKQVNEMEIPVISGEDGEVGEGMA